jgi:hypothetical protein
VSLRTALPVVLAPGGAPVPIRVDLRLEGCGGSRDTPPYLLVLSSGDAVPVAVAPSCSRRSPACGPTSAQG